MIIEVGEWLPDQPDLNNPGALTAKNCYPAQSTYKALAGISVYSDALGERPLAMTPAKATDGNSHMFAATDSKLYKLQTDATWDNVSKSGDYSNAARWEFSLYGDRVIAVTLAEDLQSYVLGTSTLFSDLTTGLKAAHVASSGEFVMVGNTSDTTDGAVPHRVRWCAIGDPTDWTVAASTQADFQDLNSNWGPVTGLMFAGDFYAFQERAITRLSYVGSPTVFDVDTFDTGRGLKYEGAGVAIGNLVFFLSEDGFYLLRYSEIIPIGAEKVNKFFFSDLSEDYADRVRATVDPINNLVFWAYPSRDSLGTLDKMLIYNWVTNRWSQADAYDLTGFGRAGSLGYTLEDLDTITTDLDALSQSLDSRAWKGGEHVLAAFNADYKLCYFSGDTLAATVDTKEQKLSKERTRVRRVRAITDATPTVKVGTRNTYTDSTTWSSAYSPNSTGDIPVRENAHYHRFRIETTGDFDHIQGVEILEASQGGKR